MQSQFVLPDQRCDMIDEIQEQESMEIETPLQQPRVKEIRKPDGSAENSALCQVPATFNKEQVNPVKAFNNVALDELLVPENK